MSQKLAIAITHGVGDQGPNFADRAITGLKEAFSKQLPEGDKTVDDKLVFASIYWAGIAARKQRILWNIVEDDGDLSFELVRKFFLHFAGDAVAYQPSKSRRQVYDDIHQTVTDTLSYLVAVTGDDAPLCIIGHSIGTVIIHNYFFDLFRNVSEGVTHPSIDTPLERGETFSMFYTLGSPLAVWSLRYNNYQPIQFPGTQVSELYPKLQPKWTNFYDKDDIIGYPIRSLSKKHQEMAQQDILTDIQISSGNLLTSWNPLSHTGYWKDSNIINPIAKDLFKAWTAVNAA